MPDINTGTDIIQLEENTEGHDIAAGDIHGEIVLLENMISKLRPTDRLFLVGDLMDRGKDSLAVIKFIKAHNQNNPQVFAVKGNHEEMLLTYIDTCLFPDDYTEEQIKSVADSYFSKRNGGSWAKSLSNAELEEIKLLIEDLPTIIYVKGQNPFIVVHADMPFNDEELLDRIAKKNLTLSDAEKDYAVWARLNHPKKPILDKGRTPESIPAYVGHTILGGPRFETNHINTDCGSSQTKHIGIVNHSTRHCVAHTTSHFIDLNVEEVVDLINTQLFLQKAPLLSTSKLPDNFKNEIKIKRPAQPFDKELDQKIELLTNTQILNPNDVTNFRFTVLVAAELEQEKRHEAGRDNPNINLEKPFKKIFRAIDDLVHIAQELQRFDNLIQNPETFCEMPNAYMPDFRLRLANLFVACHQLVVPFYEDRSFTTSQSHRLYQNVQLVFKMINEYIVDPRNEVQLFILNKMAIDMDDLERSPAIQNLQAAIYKVYALGRPLVNAEKKQSEKAESEEEKEENVASKTAYGKGLQTRLTLFKGSQSEAAIEEPGETFKKKY
jgi:hypothetical protein